MKKLITIGLVLAVVVLGWAADHYYGKAVDWREKYRTAWSTTQQQADTITDMNERQQVLAELDKTHTEALRAAKAENDHLRRQLADGGWRVYVKGKCPVSGTGQSAGASSMGDDARVELSASAGQNVLDIRAGIISDQAKLNYLQDYIRMHCQIKKNPSLR